MTVIPPINGIPAVVATDRAPGTTRPVPETGSGDEGFASSVRKALESVSAAERQADAIAVDIASGGNTGVHELMVATAKASLSVDLLVQVRNRAVEAYQEIMRMQI
jgi:flagellar hook-basal body complex protein FliE